MAALLSAALHGALVALGVLLIRPKPEERIIELQVLDLGDADEEVAPELPQAPTPPAPAAASAPAAAPPRAPPPRPRPERAEPRPAEAAVEIPPTEAPGEIAAAPAGEPAPTTFRAWQQTRRAPFSQVSAATLAAMSPPSGARRGVDRCEPPDDRRMERLYLLFDSSGSMSQTSGPNALSCAHQYAKAAIERGATVVVGNFAREAKFFGPTSSMLDVELALRADSDNTATNLPVRELQPFLDAAPDARADLVIVSDGIFPADGTLLAWYGWFFDLNPENRGRMYTVGGMGARESVSALRLVGFDVFWYDPLVSGAALP